jgi:Mce-associated membrane protein
MAKNASDTEQPERQAGSAPTQTTPRQRWLRIAAAAVAAVAIIALVVTVVLLGRAYVDDRATEQARRDAPDAAARQAVAMLGYEFGTVETELPKAADGLTGDFKSDYTTLVEQAIIPGAKEKQLTVRVSVQATSVVAASRDEVTVLLFVNQVTTSKDNPQAATSGSRVRMTMQKEDDRWLASVLTPL